VAAGIALVFGCGSYGFIVGNLDRALSKDDLAIEVTPRSAEAQPSRS